MRILLLLILSAACSPSFKENVFRSPAKTSELTAQERKIEHDKATKEFLDLHFFTEGRGLMISPGLVDVYDAAPKSVRGELMKRIFGFNVVGDKTIGFYNVKHDEHNIGVLGCVACHSGKAAGEFIIGLGNKNIDVFEIGSRTLNVEKAWRFANIRKYSQDDPYRGLTENAINFAKTLSSDDYSNLTQGLVPTGVIRTWFYRQAGKEIPEDLPRGAVKVPHMWGYGLKREVGSFADGGGDGSLAGWAIAVELVANQKPEVIRSYLPRIHHAEDLFGKFLPPKYPFFIHQKKAEAGKILFENTCAKCHGNYTYESNGLAKFDYPKWIPIEKVGTDEERLNSINEEFLSLVRTNPLSDILTDKYRGRGYFAPRLEGVWARFPYLHNGSVPTIMDLLSPPEKRPTKFSLFDAGEKYRFDSKNLGLTHHLKPIQKLRPKRRDIYKTNRPGQSNKGHNFYTNLTYKEKLQLIEYLKTL